jgi:HK97 family phage portal protein
MDNRQLAASMMGMMVQLRSPDSTQRRGFLRRRGREEDRALTRETLPGVLFPTTVAGPPVTARSTLAIADAYACVRVLADSAASLPLHVYRRLEDGSRERVRSTTAECLSNPAPAVTQAGFIGHLMLTLALWGNAFVGVFRDGEGEVQQLGLLSPERVGVRIVGGLPLYDITRENGDRQTVGHHDVVHVRSNLSIDGIMGLSPVSQAREALGLSRALMEHGAASMQNGARIPGVLTVAGSGPDQEEVMGNLRTAFGARHSGPENAGRLAVLSSDVSFTAVSMPMADAQFLEQREFSTREVCRLFGVPPWMVGTSSGDSLTYSNTAEQARAFVTFSLRPWLVAIEQAFTANDALFPPGADTYAAFELDGLLRGDAAARAAVYTQALNPLTGWMDRAEVRALEDLPAEPAREEAPADV